MQVTFASATILLFLVMDPLGSIPAFVAILRNVQEGQRVKVVVRECAIAFFVLFCFMLFGKSLLEAMQISQTSLGVAGGIILFLIAIKIIFPTSDGIFGELPGGEPFVVPLAVPMIAGPSALATSLLLVSRAPDRLAEWIGALFVAVAASTLILVMGTGISKALGERGIVAVERLMGLVLTAIAVEMFLNGIREFMKSCSMG